MKTVLCKDCGFAVLSNLEGGDKLYCTRIGALCNPIIGCDRGDPAKYITNTMGEFKAKKEYLHTNGDLVRNMSNDDISIWLWWMLKYAQGFTDSHQAVIDWLNQPNNNYIFKEI